MTQATNFRISYTVRREQTMDKRLTKIFPTRIVRVLQCANYSSQTSVRR